MQASTEQYNPPFRSADEIAFLFVPRDTLGAGVITGSASDTLYAVGGENFGGTGFTPSAGALQAVNAAREDAQPAEVGFGGFQ